MSGPRDEGDTARDGSAAGAPGGGRTPDAEPDAGTAGEPADGTALVIDDNRVVSMHYRLSDGFGELVDSSSGGLPLVYMHNTNAILPSLERELTGHRAGDSLAVTIYPEDAYGYVDESLVQRFPRESLAGLERGDGGPPGTPPLVVGLRVRALGKDGESRLATVREVDEDDVVLDANHPLAGQVLHFEIAVVAVREPTAKELAARAAMTTNPRQRIPKP